MLKLTNYEGIIYFNDGEYEGEIKEGKAFGEGVFSRDGDVWIGTFLDNQFLVALGNDRFADLYTQGRIFQL